MFIKKNIIMGNHMNGSKRDYLGRILFLALVSISVQTVVLAEKKILTKKTISKKENVKFTVTQPVMSRGYFPCNDCHNDMSVNRRRRELTREHEDIALKHTKNVWCLNCHSPENRNKLKLINGKLISFEESYLLCGQCHGLKLRDWKHGAHGKRTGLWNGEKTYYLCIACHDPHVPKFKKIKPLPPPRDGRSPRNKNEEVKNEKH